MGEEARSNNSYLESIPPHAHGCLTLKMVCKVISPWVIKVSTRSHVQWYLPWGDHTWRVRGPQALEAAGWSWWQSQRQKTQAQCAVGSRMNPGVLLRAHFLFLGKLTWMFPCEGGYLGGPIPLGTVPLQRGPAWKTSFFFQQMLSFSPDALDMSAVSVWCSGWDGNRAQSVERVCERPCSMPGSLNMFVLSQELGWYRWSYPGGAWKTFLDFP